MNPTASAVARIAGAAIVLFLAAAIGLIVGSVLNARDAGPAGGPGPFPNVWGNIADDGAAIEAPGYADPYRKLIQRAAADDAAPVTSESWGNIADADAADDTFTQTWGNLDERRDALSSDETSPGESPAAPRLR